MIMKIGFVCSSWDLLHAGHILLLQECAENCDYLIVGLQVDPTIDRPDKNKPIQTIEERWLQLNAVKYVNDIVVYKTEQDLYEFLKNSNVNIRFLGSDYKDKPYTGDDLDIYIHYHNRNHKWSSTELRNRIIKQYNDEQHNSNIERL